MKSRALLVLGLVGLLSACIGDAGPQQQSGQIEEQQSAVTTNIGPTFYPWTSTVTYAYIMQVPINTLRTYDPNYGTRYEFDATSTVTLASRSDYDPSTWISTAIGVQYPPTQNPSNNIYCTYLARYTSDAPNGWHQYLPTTGFFDAGGSPNALGALWKIQGPAAGPGACVQPQGVWSSRAPAFFAEVYFPFLVQPGGGHPTVYTNRVYIRLDLDFPEYGVTNRYFYSMYR